MEQGLWRVANPIPPWNFRRGDRNAATADDPPAIAQGPYHGNLRNKVFHGPWCQHYNCRNCTVVFESREEAIAAGYRPGGICKP